MSVCTRPVAVEGKFMRCGKCFSCQQAAKSDWMLRLQHEQEYWSDAVFVTLTYDDDHLPDGRTLVKSDLQRYLKRLRYYLDGRQIKYFACGEYGERFERPHYHLIIYGLSVADEPILYKSWQQGFIKVGTVTPRSIAYVCKYMVKDLDLVGRAGKRVYQYQQGILPPFRLMSVGLGRRWVEDRVRYLTEQKKLRRNGFDIALPKYYRRMLMLVSDDFKDFVKNKVLKLMEFFDAKLLTNAERLHYNKYRLYDWITYKHVRERYRKYLAQVEYTQMRCREMRI